MRIPGLKTGKVFYRWMRAQIYGGALILGYHRISSPSGASDEVCVSPQNFAEHLHELRKRTHPVRLSELVQHLRDGSLPEKSVAVTFDDGYADNLYAAKPLLEKYEIPATVFICTGYMGKEFWWDELERLVLSSRADPRALSLRVGERQFAWNRPQASTATGKPEAHRQLYRALYQFLLSLDVEDQNCAMREIRSWSDGSAPDISAPRSMSEEEVLQLVEGGLIEVGAHTSHHPMLPQLSFERQKEEIESGKRDLEALLGKAISGFAYPNGRVTAEAKEIVRDAGFAYACTSLHDVVRRGSDLFELTRFWQQDLDGDRFARGLKAWLSMKEL
jgi:peptidoglycan/xylan/chitin deacetylase (PgdA/CDA1 family)